MGNNHGEVHHTFTLFNERILIPAKDLNCVSSKVSRSIRSKHIKLNSARKAEKSNNNLKWGQLLKNFNPNSPLLLLWGEMFLDVCKERMIKYLNR